MNPQEAVKIILRDVATITEQIAKYTDGHETARDLIQDSCERILRLDPETDIRCAYSYFMTTCRRLNADRLRTLRAQGIHLPPLEEAESHEPRPDQELEYEETVDRIRCALAGLSPKCKRIFEMAFIEGYVYSEIATQFRVSPSMVKKYLALAKQRIEEYEGRVCARYADARHQRPARRSREAEARKRARAILGHKV